MQKRDEKYSKEIAIETFNTIRTNISFLGMDKEMKVLMVTSAIKDEGKTTMSCNIANSYASVKKRALLVDCDLRSPKVYKALNVLEQKGLPDLIMAGQGEETKYQDYVVKINEYFDVITAGFRPPNPTELLSSKRMEAILGHLRKIYDIVLLDTPPVLLVSDAIALHHLADGVLLVIKYGYTTKDALRESKRVFEVAGIRPTACIFNAVPSIKKKNNYYGYYGYMDDLKNKKKVKSDSGINKKASAEDSFINYYRRKMK
ncbi:MAG: CpsD/CapB family tyrosine-protein kinase [Eubacteriales bacterium]